MVSNTGVRGCDNSGKQGTSPVVSDDHRVRTVHDPTSNICEVTRSTLANIVHAVALFASYGSVLTDHRPSSQLHDTQSPTTVAAAIGILLDDTAFEALCNSTNATCTCTAT